MTLAAITMTAPEAASPVQMYRATYSPDDNKLRLYAASRLDPETYKKVHDAGFRWAPKQALFVAPAWTPGREDVLLSLAGEIEDEDSTLAERQEARAERFTGYSGKRASESAQALDEVERLAAMIPPGQPILVGHHSERRARRDAQRIENGMKRAVMLFERAEYWEERARSALLHAKYKERPDVRWRRIKKIEADLRKAEKTIAQSQKYLTMWRAESLDLIFEPEDNISTLVEKGCRLNMNTVLKTYQLINIDTLEASIDLLNNASTIYLFGVGGSSVIGLDIYQKLMRIGKKVIYNADLHVQMTFAQSMDQNDAALIISYSGSTTGLVDVARVLHEKQIPFISITQINSNPISKLSTYSLKVPSEEKALRIGAVSSRISSFVITDLLYYGVFKKNFEEHKKNLIDSKDNVSILKK